MKLECSILEALQFTSRHVVHAKRYRNEIENVENPFPLDGRVETCYGEEGIVKFHGPVEIKENDTVSVITVVGILLDSEFTGDSNGEFQENMYFEAGENGAIFVPADKVTF